MVHVYLHLPYGWWFRNPAFTSWYGKYPIIYRALYIPGGCLGFLNHQPYYYGPTGPPRRRAECSTKWCFFSFRCCKGGKYLKAFLSKIWWIHKLMGPHSNFLKANRQMTSNDKDTAKSWFLQKMRCHPSTFQQSSKTDKWEISIF